MSAPGMSLEDALAQFSTPVSMSASPAPVTPSPAPMAAPMAPAAPPSGNGGGGNSFGPQIQKALPMLLALMARKQGGPEAGAALLDGFARGQMQRKQAEDEALALELQTIQNEELRAARKAEHDRKRLMERESWVSNLRETLAKINDPAEYAATISSAEKYGAPIHGFQPGELAQQFAFPDSRVAEAAKTKAQARIEALRKANPTNFDDMLRANAIDSATGKPLQELMATAELLVTDQAGAPMLPTPKAPAVNVGSFEDYTLRYAKERNKKTEDLTTAELEDARKRYLQSDDRPRVTVVNAGGAAGLPPKIQSRVDAKAAQFDRQPIVKKIQLMAESVQFAESLDVNTTNPADDQALIYAFAKAMDPESVVREGEYATVQKYAQSWAQQFGFNAARIFSNTHFLTPQARKQLKATIRQKYQAAVPQYQNVRRGYAAQINRVTGRSDGDDYLIDYAGGFPEEQQTGGGPREGDVRPIPGIPGAEAKFTNGKWERVK